MEKPRVLSGEALVAKGITKIDASLPEVGLKDVMPNGSWLEQKQIQATLEARKYLIEVERIEKCGTLSHAEWRDDLMLAEVTQKAGSYWQYLGHNVGKTLYLRPEETLFLMEVNCLLLKHNEVTVSLQKAYSLLLSSSTTMIQYKVYASLSRLGYRVFRHTGTKVNCEKKSFDQKVNKVELNVDPPTISIDDESKEVGSPTAHTNKSGCINSPIVTTVNESENVDSPIVGKEKESENVDLTIDSTLSNSDNVDLTIDSTHSNSDNGGSAIETVVMNVDSSVVALEPEKAESDEPIDITVSSDTKSDNSTIADTVPDSEIVETPKDDDSVKRSENQEQQIESQAITLSESEQEQVNDQEVKGSEINGNIIEMSEVKDSEAIADQYNAENSVAKENESPNIMEVDDIELKTADNKMELETIQEVSSTMIEINKNVENKVDSMEISTENQEAAGGILIIEESVDKSNNVEATPAEEPNRMITSDVPIDIVEVVDTNEDAVSVTNSEIERRDTGTQTIEDNTKSLENVPNNNNPRNSKSGTSTENGTQKACCSKENDSYNYSYKIEKLAKRQLKPSDSEAMQRYFENIPDFSKERVVTINVPEQQFIPKNIFVNKASYTLNLQNIKMRSVRSVSSESPDYTSSDEVNGTNIRRIRSSSEVLGIEYPQNPNFFPQVRFPRYHHFRPYGFWRPQTNHNFYQMMFFQTRIQYHQRPHPFLRPACFTMNPNNLNVNNNARKRLRSGKSAHFQGIKNLATRLKQSLISGNTDMRNLESLHGLIHSYNLRYKTRLRLNEQFDVINEEKIVETIDLDDDEDSKSKKPRLENDDDKFDENLCRLRQLALRLRHLETKDKATASHRRALSKAIKTFNTSYDADIYLDDDNYEVIDRRFITLDSSSESDCVVEEQPQARPKKLRNPFNVLKRRRERSLNNPGTSKDDNSSDPIKPDHVRAKANEDNNKYSELTPKTFNESWLPKENDFGRAEIVPKRLMNSRLEFSSKEQFLYEYMKDQFQQYHNWVEAKVSFLRYLEETNNAFKRENARILADAELCNNGLKPLIDFEDSSDMPSVLEKLRIIENNKEIDTETSLRVDFDVYNRNVQNFRKKSPPQPHFRIICIDELSEVPSAAHVMSLHSKYKDNVPIVFAIVSTASISYLQINPIDLPIYVPSNDVV